MNPNETLQQAALHLQAGRFHEAEDLYLAILQVAPRHPEANHHLGLVAMQRGKAELAFPYLQIAWESDPAVGQYWLSLTECLLAMGNPGDALLIIGEAIKRGMQSPQAQQLLARAQGALGNAQLSGEIGPDLLAPQGNKEQPEPAASASSPTPAELNQLAALSNAGRHAELESLARLLVKQYPDAGFIWMLLGASLQMQGKDALPALQKTAELLPGNAEAHNNLGNALQELGRFDDAVTSYRRVLELKPDYADTHCNMGIALQKLGQLDGAVASYRRALEIKPDFAEAHCNLGSSLQGLELLDDAMASYRRALEVKPDYADAHYNLGSALQDIGQFDGATMHFRRAIEIKPDYADAHSNLGGTLLKLGQLDNAITCFRQALKIKPDLAKTHSNLIFGLDMSDTAGLSELHRERQKWDAAHAAPLWREPVHSNDRSPARRLRVGYVSGDFRNHSAYKAFGGMLTRYDRSQFDVFAYSNFKGKDDKFTDLFKQNVTAWRNIGSLSDEAVAQMIREDRIDILVDLSGHSAGNRLLVFARKPAPIQITAWGYATGTGMRAMDVFFADPVVVPPEEKRYFSEEVRYLPSVVGSFFVDPFPDVNELPALSDGVVTFGSLNRLAKVSDKAFRAWAEILLAVPRSRLILKTAELSDASTRERVIGHFTQADVAADRIIMRGGTSWSEHVQTYNQIDIALDPFPIGGGVTALEGLMMGVPVITLRWPTLAGRLSASIMTTLGLTGWIAETQEQYVELAVRMAGDLPSLATLRRQLRGIFTSSVIGDQAAYARVVEQEYRKLWQEWCATGAVDNAQLSGKIGPDLLAPQGNKKQPKPAKHARKMNVNRGAGPGTHDMKTLVALFIQGRYAETETLARTMTVRFPNHGFGWKVLGAALKPLGRNTEALESIRKAAELLPDDAETWSNLGSALMDQGSLPEAEAAFRRALKIKPGYADAHYNLGNALREIGRFDDAVTSYRRALEIKPDYIEAHNNMGAALQELQQFNGAAASYRRALEIKPDYAEAHNNLGNALRDLGQFNDAIACFRRAIEIKPDYADAHLNLGIVLQKLGQHDDAMASYRRALEIKPDYVDAHSNLIFGLDLSDTAGLSELHRERQKWDKAHAAPLWREPVHSNDRSPARRLRVGYVSGDFREHSASKAFGGMLTRYDRSQFDVFAYSNFKGRNDRITDLFRQNVTAWRNIGGLPDEAVARMIRDDRIDILVDLSGFTAGNRLLVFARKPAPIQITAWGYATGTGMRAMDVFFADPVVAPPEEKHYFSEEVRYLPSVVGSFFIDPFPGVNELPALSDGIVTFGSLNRLAKVAEKTYRAWADILLAVPRSRLVLKIADMNTAQFASTQERVIGHFTEAGVAADRIIMRGGTSWSEHVQTYNQIDMALDPFSHGGGVTALEGLMMGVPMITLRWPTLAGRLSASIMTTLGLTGWIAETQEQYVDLAVRMADDLPSLATLRRQLRGIFTSSVIGDPAAYARAVEQEYRKLWQEWCATGAGAATKSAG